MLGTREPIKSQNQTSQISAYAHLKTHALYSQKLADSFVGRMILDVDDLPEPIILEDGIKAFPWHIDTKYYTADVNLCSVEKKTLDSEEFAVSVEAVVINFDSNINAGLNIAESWLSFLKEFEPEVQILLCDRCEENPSEGVSKVAGNTSAKLCLAAMSWGTGILQVPLTHHDCPLSEATHVKRAQRETKELMNPCRPSITLITVHLEKLPHLDQLSLSGEVGSSFTQEWCVDQGFELVELDPELDAEWEAEQDFLETTGIKRVVQAMHSHLWPNLRMKGKPQQLSRTVQSMLNGNDLDPTLSTLGQDLQNLQLDPVTNSNNYNANVNTAIEDRIDELLGDSGGVAGFSSLFEQLHNMKACVQGLPSDQRKACAEQVVMAFWHAIGGDEDELEGLGGADGGT
uniref:Alpha-and gamma-adaptin-binding protein p34 n=1 Tax=Timema tahoe TaxID=61484 RepID=A0A7R9NXV4_9NEOP|nr:unnamed protein product [Timema tahoe]